MNIQNETWDHMVSEALELIEHLESFQKTIVIPARQTMLALLYGIVHLENSPSEMDEIVESVLRLEKMVKICKRKVKAVKRKSSDSDKSIDLV